MSICCRIDELYVLSAGSGAQHESETRGKSGTLPFYILSLPLSTYASSSMSYIPIACQISQQRTLRNTIAIRAICEETCLEVLHMPCAAC
jgi:hypothetical protein